MILESLPVLKHILLTHLIIFTFSTDSVVCFDAAQIILIFVQYCFYSSAPPLLTPHHHFQLPTTTSQSTPPPLLTPHHHFSLHTTTSHSTPPLPTTHHHFSLHTTTSHSTPPLPTTHHYFSLHTTTSNYPPLLLTPHHHFQLPTTTSHSTPPLLAAHHHLSFHTTTCNHTQPSSSGPRHDKAYTQSISVMEHCRRNSNSSVGSDDVTNAAVTITTSKNANQSKIVVGFLCYFLLWPYIHYVPLFSPQIFRSCSAATLLHILKQLMNCAGSSQDF